MARVTPLLSSTSRLLMLLPIVLMLLVASWPTPAVEARILQAHDKPQWIQEIHQSPVDDKMPLEEHMRMRRSPQEPEQKEEPNFFSSLWTSVKNFATMAYHAVCNLFGGICGGSSCGKPDTNDATTPKPSGDRKSPEPGEREGGYSGHFDNTERSSTPSVNEYGESSTRPNYDGGRSPTLGEGQENSGIRIGDDISPMSDSGERSSPPSSDIGVPSRDNGRPPLDNRGNGTYPLPTDDRETTSESDVLPVTNSAENEIPDN